MCSRCFFFFPSFFLCIWNRVSTTVMLQDEVYEDRVLRSKEHFQKKRMRKKKNVLVFGHMRVIVVPSSFLSGSLLNAADGDDHFTFIFCHLKGHWFICFHMKCLYCILTKLFHVMDSNAKE